MILRIGHLDIYKRDLETHVHGIGKSRSGKSKLIEHIARQLISQRQGFCLIDPHGSLFRDVLQWLAYMRPSRPIVLFEPSNTRRIVGYNPFWLSSKEPAEITTKAEKMVAATMRVWGATSASSTPRLAKWLKRFYYTLIEQDLSITAAEYFLDYRRERERNRIIANIKNQSIKSQWEQLYAMKQAAFQTFIESTENRLEVFTHPQVKRILGLRQNTIDLREILREQAIFLVNLQPSTYISDESNRVLGTLLINELWQIVRERTKAYPFFLIVDECQKYLTPDVSAMLDEAAKYGLHLMLFHQREAQLDKDLSSALQNAQTKFIFSTEDEPKEQRRFTYVNPKGSRIEAEVQEIKTLYVRPERIEAYKESLLKDFLTAQQVDELLTLSEEEEPVEITEQHLYR
jgi:type IV secretory pathway TraG/TraD family ATPase VirD4